MSFAVPYTAETTSAFVLTAPQSIRSEDGTAGFVWPRSSNTTRTPHTPPSNTDAHGACHGRGAPHIAVTLRLKTSNPHTPTEFGRNCIQTLL